MTRMETFGHIPQIELITNSGDEFHLKGHAAPLIEYLAARDADVLSVTEFDLGPGHRTPDNNAYYQIMRDIYAKHLTSTSARTSHRSASSTASLGSRSPMKSEL